MNKKGATESFLSFGFLFFILVLIGGTIIIGVVAYWAGQTDVRPIQAEMLSKRVAGCLGSNMEMIENYFDRSSELLQNCALEKETIEKSGLYYINLQLIRFEEWTELEKPKISKEIHIGTKDVAIQCGIVGNAKETKTFASCAQRNLLINYEKGGESKQAIIKILVGSNNK